MYMVTEAIDYFIDKYSAARELVKDADYTPIIITSGKVRKISADMRDKAEDKDKDKDKSEKQIVYEMKYDIIIVGGGASGLMLAAGTNLNNRRGLIVESTSHPGTKLLMSGGRHCNITHAGSVKDFPVKYGSGRAAVGDNSDKTSRDADKLRMRILRSCLYKHSNIELINWLEECGLPVITNEEGRIFPASMKAMDVLDLLVRQARKNGWEIGTDVKVIGFGEKSLEVMFKGGFETLSADKIVIACGGVTCPETGSDGSVLGLLGYDLGIDVVEPRSALAQVYVKDYPYRELSGVSLSKVRVSVYERSETINGAKSDGRKLAEECGDLLFTHDGFSGPAVLNISRWAEPGRIISFNYEKAIVVGAGSGEALPRRFRKLLEDRARGSAGDIKSKELAKLLTNDSYVVQSVDSRGMVSCGGVDLAEVEPQTMELKKCPGMYVIGEALDIDGATGGYNLQLCYSTAMAVADVLSR